MAIRNPTLPCRLNRSHGSAARGVHARPLALLFACIVALPLSCLGNPPQALPALNVDIAETSLSGISSGAFMAVQFEVAHSVHRQGCGYCRGRPLFLQPRDHPRRNHALFLHAGPGAPCMQRLRDQRRCPGTRARHAALRDRPPDRQSEPYRRTARIHLRRRQGSDRSGAGGRANCGLLRPVFGAGAKHVDEAARQRRPHDADGELRPRLLHHASLRTSASAASTERRRS